MVDFNKLRMQTRAGKPDEKINERERSKQADQPRLLLVVTSDDPVRSFSPRELKELRMRMLEVQANGSGQNQLTAMRMVTLIDHHERALDQTENVRQALSGDADLDGLEAKISNARDEILGELDRETADALGERLLTTGADLAKVTPAVQKWYSERIAAIRKEVTAHLDALHAWRKEAAAALAQIDPDI